MPNLTKIAVLGAGRWGIHLVRNFLQHPQAQIVAVVDPQAERLAALSQQLQLDRDIVLSTDGAAVLQMPGLEAVAIATPAVTHYSLVAAALKQGCHVLAEKPLTLNLAESLELCHLATQQQRQLVVDHTYLFHPAVQRGTAAVRSGILGDLRYGYATRTHLGPVRQDVDALWDLAIHDIAIFNTWLGQLPIQVEAKGTVWLQPEQRDSERSPTGLADLVWVTLTYPTGFQAFIHLCWLNPDKQRRLGMVGNQGTLIFDELQIESPLTLQRGQLATVSPATLVEAVKPAATFTPIDQSREVLRVLWQEPLQQVCDHFLTCVQQNTASPISSGWVGAHLVQILGALSASLNQAGQPIAIADYPLGEAE